MPDGDKLSGVNRDVVLIIKLKFEGIHYELTPKLLNPTSLLEMVASDRNYGILLHVQST